MWNWPWLRQRKSHSPGRSRLRLELLEARNCPSQFTPVACEDHYYPLHDSTFETTSQSSVLANDYDEDNDPIAIVQHTTPAHGELTLNTATGDFVYVAAAGYTGDDSFEYTMSDGFEVATATVHLHVSNNAPASNDDDYDLLHDSTLDTASQNSILVNDADADADALTIVNFTAPAHGELTLDTATGHFVYVPVAGYTGDDSFEYTISDGAGEATATVHLHVSNIAPASNDDHYDLLHGTTLDTSSQSSILVNDSDADADALIILGFTAPAHGELTLDTFNGHFVYVAAAGYTGDDSFAYTISDGAGEATATVHLHVSNNAPSGTDDYYTTLHDATFDTTAGELSVLANDFDNNGDTLTIVAFTTPAHGNLTLDVQTGDFVYVPEAGYAGEDSFTYTASDGAAETTATVHLQISNQTPAAALANLPSNPLEAELVSVSSGASDPDDDPLTHVWSVALAGNVVATGTDADFSFTPADDGAYEITLTVSDGVEQNSASSTLNIANVAPEMDLQGAASVDEGVAYGLSVSCSDPGVDTITTALVAWGDGAEEQVDANDLQNLSHVYDGPGTFYVGVTVTDEDGSFALTAPKEVIVNNLAPVLTLSVAYGANRMVTLSGQVQDTQPAGLTVSFSGQVADSVVTDSEGTFTLTVQATALGDIQATTTDYFGAGSNSPTVTLASTAPMISGFSARLAEENGNCWIFEGYVDDESKAGLTILFGGASLPSLQGQTAISDSDGFFRLTLDLEEGEEGIATALATDWWGITSNLAQWCI